MDRLVRTWMATEQEREVEEAASGACPKSQCLHLRLFRTEIAQGNVTLLQIIKSLGEFLTAEEDDLRTKGTCISSRSR